MFRALNTAASGMIAQQLNLDNIANNLANASTAGFRKRRLQFQDLLYQNLVMPGAASTQQTTYSTGLQIGLGARSSSSEMIQTQGDFEQTGNQLDLAIQGNGFFQVQLPSGELAYTRAGSFQVDAAGTDRHRRRLRPAASHHHSQQRHQHHHRHRRHRQRGHPRPAAGPAGGTDPAGHVCQSRRTQQHRAEPVSAHHRFRRRHPGHARRQRGTGHHPAGAARTVQRERGRRIRRDDPGAALLRVQFEGRAGRRPDVSGRQLDVALCKRSRPSQPF